MHDISNIHQTHPSHLSWWKFEQYFWWQKLKFHFCFSFVEFPVRVLIVSFKFIHFSTKILEIVWKLVYKNIEIYHKVAHKLEWILKADYLIRWNARFSTEIFHILVWSNIKKVTCWINASPHRRHLWKKNPKKYKLWGW